MRDVMVDIETLGTGTLPVIASIGAVQFDLESGKLGERFHYYVDIRDSAAQGFRLCSDTVLWWMRQDDDARLPVFTASPRLSINRVLTYLAVWLPNNAYVWGNGSNFDNRILREAYVHCGIKTPWSFRRDLDMRTFMELGERLGISTEKPPRETVLHDALADAVYQAEWMCNIWSSLRG
jgi:hypothetical protein